MVEIMLKYALNIHNSFMKFLISNLHSIVSVTHNKVHTA